MKEITLASQMQCTACGACMQACPKECIHMMQDAMDCRYPEIDRAVCVQCGKCIRVCPALQETDLKQKPLQVYAAWNTDEQIRLQAASGGIASAIYAYALDKGYKTFGVCYEPGGQAVYMQIQSLQDIEKCRNSKYVFSDISSVLQTIKEYLAQGETVILPALPCQVAAVLRFLGGRQDRLILIDIICHGVCPTEYLNQHIAAIEKKKKKQADTLLFRDPAFGTNRFVLSLYANGKRFYHKKVHAQDVYQLGYHYALNYRENCYHCAYATPDRLGDLTISDFSGLGRLEPFCETRQSVSCVMVSSNAGAQLLEQLQQEGRIICQARPIREALDYERQLKAPSVPHKNRQIFVDTYQKGSQYDAAARKALRRDMAQNCLRNILHVEQAKRLAAKILPQKVKEILKQHR